MQTRVSLGTVLGSKHRFTGRRGPLAACDRVGATEAGDSAQQRSAIRSNGVEALVLDMVRSRRRWQDVQPAPRCEALVHCANAADNTAASPAVNGSAWLTTSTPLTGDDDDYND